MDEAPEKPASSKPSPIPSWVSLGFVLGALFVLALPRRPFEARPAPAVAAPERPQAGHPRPAPRLTTIEAVFANWGSRAVWDNDVTEVALWDSGTQGFTDCYEVIRAGSTYFFRSIPYLTRPVLTHGIEDRSPLRFTETEQKRREWLEDVRKENWRAFSEGARQSLGPGAGTGDSTLKVEPVIPPPTQTKPDEPSPRL